MSGGSRCSPLLTLICRPGGSPETELVAEGGLQKKKKKNVIKFKVRLINFILFDCVMEFYEFL